MRILVVSPLSSTQGAYYTQPVYAAQPHVIHHTTVVQPNSIPSAIYPAAVAAPRTNGVAMGMVAGTTMAMSAGEHQHWCLCVCVVNKAHQLKVCRLSS